MTLCYNNLLNFGKIIFALLLLHLLISEICTSSLLICRFTSRNLFMVLIDTSRGLRQQIYLQYVFIKPVILYFLPTFSVCRSKPQPFPEGHQCETSSDCKFREEVCVNVNGKNQCKFEL